MLILIIIINHTLTFQFYNYIFCDNFYHKFHNHNFLYYEISQTEIVRIEIKTGIVTEIGIGIGDTNHGVVNVGRDHDRDQKNAEIENVVVHRKKVVAQDEENRHCIGMYLHQALNTSHHFRYVYN